MIFFNKEVKEGECILSTSFGIEITQCDVDLLSLPKKERLHMPLLVSTSINIYSVLILDFSSTSKV